MIRIDDPLIAGGMLLYRRIPPEEGSVTWEDGKPDFSSYNFADKIDELSFNIAAETTQETLLIGHEGYGLIQITAESIRSACTNQETKTCSIVICRDDENPANGHVLVCGPINPKMRKRIKRAASWVDGRWPTRPNPFDI
jgi:hypothetical protein